MVNSTNMDEPTMLLLHRGRLNTSTTLFKAKAYPLLLLPLRSLPNLNQQRSSQFPLDPLPNTPSKKSSKMERLPKRRQHEKLPRRRRNERLKKLMVVPKRERRRRLRKRGKRGKRQRRRRGSRRVESRRLDWEDLFFVRFVCVE